MMNRLFLTSAIVLVISAHRSVFTQDSRPPNLAGDVVPKLQALAEWCQEARLLGQRDRVYGDILTLEPLNADARKALKFTKLQDGTWKQAQGYARGQDVGKSSLPEYERRRSDILGPFIEAQVIAARGAADHGKSSETLRILLALEPEDPRVHDALGEAKLGDKWVLVETKAAAERRKVLAAAVSGVAGVRAAEAKPEPEDVKLGMARAVAATPRVHVAGLLGYAETLQLAALGHSSLVLLDAVFGERKAGPRVINVHAVTNEAEAAALLGKQPAPIPDQETAFFARLQGGVWLSRVHFDRLAVSGPTTDARLDTAIRAIIAGEMCERFGSTGVSDSVTEAVSTHLAWLVRGRRLIQQTASGDLTHDEEELQYALCMPKADWFKEARQELARGRLPPLKDVVAGTVLSVRPGGQLYAYVFGVYLLLGHPAELPKIVAGIGVGKGVEASVTTGLSMDIETVDRRVRRWLIEAP